MSKEVKALEDLKEMLQRGYEESLQTLEDTQVAHREGILYGIDLSIIALEALEEASDENNG